MFIRLRNFATLQIDCALAGQSCRQLLTGRLQKSVIYLLLGYHLSRDVIGECLPSILSPALCMSDHVHVPSSQCPKRSSLPLSLPPLPLYLAYLLAVM